MSPTHTYPCFICGEPASCYQDEHALGIGGPDGDGGCYREPHVEFCSLACAEELRRRINASIANYHSLASGGTSETGRSE